MSIPRFAIQRPVMMMMLSCIIILLGGISLSRLPVDLLPDISQPTVNVRVNYTGVGPLEMEELVIRPLEQQLSAVAGLEQMTSNANEGSASIQLNFVWGSDLNEAMNEIRKRIDRVRGRLPEDADPPQILKFDSNSAPIMGLALESTDGSLNQVALRELAENVLSQRIERVPGVAAVTVGGGLRRQIHVNLSREKITALDLSVDRVVNILKSENQNIPIGEVYQGDRALLLRSQGEFQNLEQISNLAVMTKNGVPVYVRDIAEVADATEDVRPVLRINGRPGVRLQVTKQSGTNTVQIATGVREEIARINREVPGVRISLLDDSAKFIERSIGAVQEHVMIGSLLVVLIIFMFLRNFRSTLIVCTSIPISVIGTFALLYFGGLTLNTMTFGGLALGVGMIVDAAIVVLENSFRHMEHHGKDRMTAAIDGSEEVWSAILASILTHIAVFVPLLFLEGISSVMFRQLSIVVVFSLLMSLFVAVTLVPVLCSRLLVLPPPPDKRSRIGGQLYAFSERFLEGMDEIYRKLLHLALSHRDSVVGAAAVPFPIAIVILPTLPTAAPPRAVASRLGGRRGRGVVRDRDGHPADAPDRARHPGRRGAGAGLRRARPGHAHRDHRSGPGSHRERHQGIRPRTDRSDHAGWPDQPRLRWARRQLGQPRQPAAAAQAQGRTDPLERADRHGSAAAVVGDSRRHRPRLAVGRQQPVESFPVGRQQRRRPAGARDSRPEPGRRPEGGARGERPARHGARCGRRAPRARRCAARARRTDRHREGGAPRPQSLRRREHHAHQRRRHPGGALPPGRTGVSDHRPPQGGSAPGDRRHQRRARQHAAGPGDAGKEPDAR